MAFIRSGGFRVLLLLVGLSAFAAGAGGVFFYVTVLRDLPNLQRVEDFRPTLASQVLDRAGKPIGEFYNQRRYIAPLDSIPEHTLLAFVAAEDQKFYAHAGIDYQAILRAAWVDLRAGQIKEGASTITMQLVKQLLLTPERKFKRKIREMLLAKQIESRFSKDEILYMYLNQIYFGHGAWGIGEAARSYFDKSVGELTVSESALLAGLPQRPSQYSPFRDPKAAEVRRRSVVGRMLTMHAIDRAGYEVALADVPALSSGRGNPDYALARSFAEEVRRYLFERLGGEVVLNGGLKIETTLDLDLQRAAILAISDGLYAHDHRYGYRGPVRHVEADQIQAEIDKLAEENAKVLAKPDAENAAPSELAAVQDETATAPDTIDAAEIADVPFALPVEERLLGVVTAIDPKAQIARVAFAPGVEGQVFLKDIDWAREPQPKRRPRPVRRITSIFERGDVAWFQAIAKDGSKAPYAEDPEERSAELPRVGLFQQPKVEGALLSFDINSGDILAMVGGRSYADSQFNRATQARRQPGSAFKPFIYGAALARGYTPVSMLYDRPIVIEDEQSGFVWRPRNYGRHFYGPMPMRRALAKSVNNATVHLFRDLGVDYVIDYARRLGMRSPLSRDLTLALGSSGVSLLELTTAYAVFPNGGRRVVPRFITRVTDRDGKVLLEDVPLGDPPPPVLKPLIAAGEEQEEGYPDGEILPTDQIITPAEAFLMCNLLQAVVQEGTGRGVRRLNGHIGGKTGTTNDQADAWFMGFSPDIATGVWVGYDSVKLLGWGETGATTALPIWRDYMKVALAKTPLRDFEAPDQIVFERIDRTTGLLADASNKDAYFQPFLGDTAPTEFASKQMTVTDTQRSLREDAFQ